MVLLPSGDVIRSADRQNTIDKNSRAQKYDETVPSFSVARIRALLSEKLTEALCPHELPGYAELVNDPGACTQLHDRFGSHHHGALVGQSRKDAVKLLLVSAEEEQRSGPAKIRCRTGCLHVHEKKALSTEVDHPIQHGALVAVRLISAEEHQREPSRTGKHLFVEFHGASCVAVKGKKRAEALVG